MPVTHREFAAIDTMLRMRADASQFRATYTEAAIEVFRRYDSDVEDMLATFGIGERSGQPPRSGSQPVLRFVLLDEQSRKFAAEQFQTGAWRRLEEALAARSLVEYLKRFLIAEG